MFKTMMMMLLVLLIVKVVFGVIDGRTCDYRES